MMKHEFEALAGYEVSTETYDNIIEPMYMASPLAKAEFVKTLNRKAFDLNEKRKALIKEMKAIAAERKENAEHFSNYEAESKLYDLADEYAHTLDGLCIAHISRKLTYGTFGCSYPAELIVDRSYYSNERHEVARIKLA